MLNPNPMAWFEIVTQDLEAAINFYQSVFNISLTKEQMGPITMAIFPYQAGQTGGALVSGDCYNSHSAGSGTSIIYLSVHSISGCLVNIEQHQGKIAFPCMAIGEHGYIAGFIDPEGNVIGIWSDQA